MRSVRCEFRGNRRFPLVTRLRTVCAVINRSPHRGAHDDDDYLVECFWPGVSVADLDDLDRRARWIVRVLRGRGVPVRYLGSLLVPQDEVALFEVRAASHDLVADASRLAGIPFERIVRTVRRSTGD